MLTGNIHTALHPTLTEQEPFDAFLPDIIRSLDLIRHTAIFNRIFYSRLSVDQTPGRCKGFPDGSAPLRKRSLFYLR